MLVAELIRNWREDAKDDVKPYFWSDRQLLRWLNAGLRRYALETRSLIDSSSPFTQHQLEPGADRLRLDDRIIEILQASTLATPKLELLKPGTLPLLGRVETGHPRQLEIDIDARQMRLYPVPERVETLQLLVIRLPLCPVDHGGEITDIPEQDVELLNHYLDSEAYQVQDAETIDPRRAAEGLAQFLAGCTQVLERTQARRRTAARPVRYRW
ncbi:hypothetical protein SB18R_03285 [Pseudomonas oryzihabitans]|nr:hypothetical protein SB9_12520 [Pseudomonas psychrotolerans]KTT78267.1 hypothetical protein SB18R_03285 [Pseudomonas psychrotolerans]